VRSAPLPRDEAPVWIGSVPAIPNSHGAYVKRVVVDAFAGGLDRFGLGASPHPEHKGPAAACAATGPSAGATSGLLDLEGALHHHVVAGEGASGARTL